MSFCMGGGGVAGQCSGLHCSLGRGGGNEFEI